MHSINRWLWIPFFFSCTKRSLFVILIFGFNRDETLEALSDAQIVAPAAKTVDLHSANHRNSFLYVFDYQTKFGDFPQVNHFLFKLHCNSAIKKILVDWFKFTWQLFAIIKWLFRKINCFCFSLFQQRQGCIHGEDLPYIFGAPLIGGFGHFPRNYTKSEISLSEAVMLYWSNFVRSG